jgi:hypothetical protein
MTLRHTTLGRTTVDEWSSHLRDLYLAKHNTRERQTSIPRAGFEPAIPASERLHTHALDRAATGIGCTSVCLKWNSEEERPVELGWNKWTVKPDVHSFLWQAYTWSVRKKLDCFRTNGCLTSHCRFNEVLRLNSLLSHLYPFHIP